MGEGGSGWRAADIEKPRRLANQDGAEGTKSWVNDQAPIDVED
jgi:hypothetical protein